MIDAKTEDDTAKMEVEEVDNNNGEFAAVSHSRALVSPNDKEFDLIAKRVRLLVDEGRGECIFEVGLGTDPPVNEDEAENGHLAEDAEEASGLNKADYDASVATLRSIADTLEADCVLLRERILSGGGGSPNVPPEAKRTGQYLIRKRADTKVKWPRLLSKCYCF